jgi:hypothetical protein
VGAVGRFSPKGSSSYTTSVGAAVASSVGASVVAGASVVSAGVSDGVGVGAQAATATPIMINAIRRERVLVNLVISFLLI